jgi:hypothetical protein
MTGDARHKRGGDKTGQEDVTDEFRAQVRETLARNKAKNALTGARRGDPDYLISSQAELAEATRIDPTLLGRIVGAVRPTSRVRLVARAVGLDRIRAALGLPEIVRVSVRASRAPTLEQIADLPEDEFRLLADRVAKLRRPT